MRVQESVREGWRDVVSGAAAAGVFAVVFGVLLGGIVGVRAAGVAAEVRRAHTFVASGAATTVVQAAGRIDGRACDALVAIPDVRAAGALRDVEDGPVPSALPRSVLPTYEITRGFPTLLTRTGTGADDVTVGRAGVLASNELADELGLRPGEMFATTSGSTPVDSVYAYPDDGRDPDVEYALLAPAIDDGRPFDACWATIWPEDESAVTAVRRTVLPSTGAEGEDRVTTGQLNPRLGRSFAAGSDWPDQRGTSVLALAAGVVVGWVALVRRRLSVASDRHVGVRVEAQVVAMVVQHLTWALVGAAAVGAAVVVLVRGLVVADALPIVVEASGSVLLGAVGAVVGGALGLVAVRERALHRYFRTR